MKEEFSLDVDENTINELKKAIGYDEIEARHKRFMEGKETADDLMNHIYHYEIKNDKGLDLYVVELKYYKKLVKIIDLMVYDLMHIDLIPYRLNIFTKEQLIEQYANKYEEGKGN